MAQEEDHPIFDDIARGNLEEVQRRVRADAAGLEERVEDLWELTPLMLPSTPDAARHRPLADQAPGPAQPGHDDGSIL